MLAALGWTDPDNDPLTYSWDVNGDGNLRRRQRRRAHADLVATRGMGINNGPSTFNVQRSRRRRTRRRHHLGAVALSVLNVAADGQHQRTFVCAARRGSRRSHSRPGSLPVDQAGTFTYTINWGDGSPIQTVTSAAAAQVTHRFDAAGALTVSVVAADQDGGAGAAATKNVNVDAVQLRPNADNPSLTDLVWGGTEGNDSVAFQQVNAGTIRVDEHLLYGAAVNNSQSFSGVTGRVIAYGDPATTRSTRAGCKACSLRRPRSTAEPATTRSTAARPATFSSAVPTAAKASKATT